MKLVLHIERVVVEGIPLDAHQRDQLRLQLEQELAGRLLDRPLSPALAGGTAVPALAAPTVHLDADTRGPGATAGLASGVAASVASTLAGGPR